MKALIGLIMVRVQWSNRCHNTLGGWVPFVDRSLGIILIEYTSREILGFL
jgi:hypothetical protein